MDTPITPVLDQTYWSMRYEKQETGWDTGGATPPIAQYFDRIDNKDVRILIPGCGNAHEAEYLHRLGFRAVYICDWAEAPLADFARRCPDFPADHLLCMNFFDIKIGDFDYIIEQTFFCALPPSLRADYIRKIWQLLAAGGKLVGLLFRFPLSASGPPFGGSEHEYRQYFRLYFDQIHIQPCTTSIKPRQGNEFWIEIGGRKEMPLVEKSFVEIKVFAGVTDPDSTYDGKQVWRYDIYATFYEGSETYAHWQAQPDFYTGRIRQQGRALVPVALLRNGFAACLMDAQAAAAHQARYGQGVQLPLTESLQGVGGQADYVQRIADEVARNII